MLIALAVARPAGRVPPVDGVDDPWVQDGEPAAARRPVGGNGRVQHDRAGGGLDEVPPAMLLCVSALQAILLAFRHP